MMMWQDYETDVRAGGPLAILIELLAVAFGAGAILLVLHWLGLMALIQQWAALR